MKKYLYLILIAFSFLTFAKDKALNAPPIVEVEEIPNLMATIVSVDKVNSNVLILLGDKKITVKIDKKTHIRFIGRLNSKNKKITVKELASGLKVSINSKNLFYDLKKNKIDTNKVYRLSYLEIGNQK